MPMAVTVLGKTFESEEERRDYFRQELRKKLPELKKIEGFPIGYDEDIIELSDPPYYTTCPNPWLNDFIARWEGEKNDSNSIAPSTPYPDDVKASKGGQIYRAHSYHTKVPHTAIMRYILYYTNPGDIVFDGFAGTGMTGVASQVCDNPKKSTKLKIEKEFQNNFLDKPNWGKRHSICSDLSTVAGFIANGYNTPVEKGKFIKEARQIFDSLEKKYGDYYQTLNEKGNKCKVSYYLWSEVVNCNNCGHEQTIWSPNESLEDFSMDSTLTCNNCGVTGSKNFKPVFETIFDPFLNEAVPRKKYVPVLINYFDQTKRKYKVPDKYDLEKIEDIQSDLSEEIDDLVVSEIRKGVKTNELLRDNYKFIHQLFTSRNLIVLKNLWDRLNIDRGRLILTSTLTKTSSILHNVGFRKGKINLAGALPNALYVPGVFAERNIFELHKRKLKDLSFDAVKSRGTVQVGSATDLETIEQNSIDYIYTDPPFGGNLMYSELNSIHEGWLKVETNYNDEAIINSNQNKGISDYHKLMTASFSEYYRILKPGRWMTVEFNSTKASVWNTIRVSLTESGFIITDVTFLNKGQGTFNSQTNPTSAKQDLVITCYKPSKALDESFSKNNNTGNLIWTFIEDYLTHIKKWQVVDNSITPIIERTPKMLYNRLNAFFMQRGIDTTIDAQEFNKKLKEKFIERDGMIFTYEQAHEYDQKKSEVPSFTQLSLLVTSEQDGIIWLKDALSEYPKEYQELYSEWVQAISDIRKGDVLPELNTILNENFLQNEEGKWYVPDPENEEDLEKLRKRRLLKQFVEYKEQAFKPKGKIKECRVEALRAGFKECYQDKDFETIVRVGDRIPNNLLMEDEVLLQFYDIAANKV